MAKKIKSKNILLISLAAIMLVVSGAAYAYKSSQNNKHNTTIGADNAGVSGDQENAPVEASKENADRRAELEKEAAQDQSSTKKSVSVVITNAQSDSINSYVSGVFEDNGTCTAAITKGDSQVLKTSKGFKDATHTTCEPIFLKRSDFPSSGTWSVKVSYSSNTSEGLSQAVKIEIR